jgi:hypothetical protein
MKSKFIKVYGEIDIIEIKTAKKTGFLFFKSHVYTINDLLNSEHHQKINSITEKIGDDIQGWFNLGKLDKEEEESYYTERINVDEALRKINKNIAMREPTWWEEVREPFHQFVEKISDNMPDELKRTLLGFIKEITIKKIPFVKKLLDKIPKLITSKT